MTRDSQPRVRSLYIICLTERGGRCSKKMVIWFVVSVRPSRSAPRVAPRCGYTALARGRKRYPAAGHGRSSEAGLGIVVDLSWRYDRVNVVEPGMTEACRGTSAGQHWSAGKPRTRERWLISGVVSVDIYLCKLELMLSILVASSPCYVVILRLFEGVNPEENGYFPPRTRHRS
jgi:hypothetical protein